MFVIFVAENSELGAEQNESGIFQAMHHRTLKYSDVNLTVCSHRPRPNIALTILTILKANLIRWLFVRLAICFTLFGIQSFYLTEISFSMNKKRHWFEIMNEKNWKCFRNITDLLIWFREYWSSRSMHLIFACVKWPVTNLTSVWFAHMITIEPLSLCCNFTKRKKLKFKINILSTTRQICKIMEQICLLIMRLIFSVLSSNIKTKWQFANSAASNGVRSPIEIIGIFARSKMSCKIGQ